MINETVNELSHLFTEKGQRLVLLGAQNTEPIIADKFQLKRVIINFLSNAVNYGYKNTEIIVSVKIDKNNISLDVQNNAPYIPPEKMVDMYKKYKSSNNAKFQKTGTGLGLYLAKQIVDAHNGTVYATSTEDNVCNFGFSIPTKRKFENISLV